MQKAKERSYQAELPIKDINSVMYERQQIDTERLNETTQNIKAKGVIEPIIVRRTKDGFQIIAGYLRFLASQKAERETIPALVYDSIEDLEATDILIMENVHRQELSDIDEANILNVYVKKGFEQQQIAERINKSQPYVSLKLKLLEDAEPLRTAISDGTLTEQKARLLRNLPSEKLLKTAIKKVTDKDLTVKQTRMLVNETLEKHKIEVLRSQLKEKKTKLSEIADFKKEREKLAKQIEDLKATQKTLKTDNKDINKAVRQIMELENRYYPALNEITELTSRVNALQKERPQNPDNFIKSLEKERKAVTEKEGKLKAQIETLREQLKDLNTQHKKQREEESTINQKIRQIQAVESEIRQAENRKTKLNDLVTTFEKSHKTAIADFDKLKQRVETHTKDIIEQKQKIHTAIAETMQKKMSLNGKIANEQIYVDAISTLEKQIKSLSKKRD